MIFLVWIRISNLDWNLCQSKWVEKQITFQIICLFLYAYLSKFYLNDIFDRFQNADFSENFHSIFFQLKKVQNFGKSHSIFFPQRFNRKWYEDKKK